MNFDAILPIPFRKLAQAFAQGGAGLETKVALQGRGVGISYGHIAGLHGNELLMGIKVVIGGKHSGTH